MPPRPSTALADLLRDNPRLWRGRDQASVPALTTGFEALDSHLPGGGWPVGSLVEIVPVSEGVGELRLVLPLLRALCAASRNILWVRPPHIPYAPALARAGVRLKAITWVETAQEDDARWCAEQALRESTTGAVLLWSETTDQRALRRLQLAAELGATFAFLYRQAKTRSLAEASPAALRMALEPIRNGVAIQLLKVRGGRTARIEIPLHSSIS